MELLYLKSYKGSFLEFQAKRLPVTDPFRSIVETYIWYTPMERPVGLPWKPSEDLNDFDSHIATLKELKKYAIINPFKEYYNNLKWHADLKKSSPGYIPTSRDDKYILVNPVGERIYLINVSRIRKNRKSVLFSTISSLSYTDMVSSAYVGRKIFTDEAKTDYLGICVIHDNCYYAVKYEDSELQVRLLVDLKAGAKDERCSTNFCKSKTNREHNSTKIKCS